MALFLPLFLALLGAPSAERIIANDNRAPAGTLRDGVLTIALEVRRGTWYPEADDGPGIPALAFAEAGGPPQIPGPMIRVPEGTEIRVTIRNTESDSTLVLYGLHTRPGSPDDSLHIAPGATREVRFTAGAPGTYYYWGSTTGRHVGDREWHDSQLAGALIVDPRGTTPPPDERVFLIGIWFHPADSLDGVARPEQEVMTMNGKSWPHTERLTFTQGDTVRWRWINASASSHPMHLHGFYFQVDSRGSWAADTIYQPAERRAVATELMLSGGTVAVRWVPERPGNWVFHCHFAFHISHHLKLPEPTAPGGDASGDGHALHSMAGLVLGLHVLPRPGSIAAETPRDPRRLRLLVQSAPGRFGDQPGFGYALDTGEARPADEGVAVPGPTLVLERGQPVAITVVNRLDEPTAVHWHGIELESFPDGVPGWSGAPGRILAPIAPGDSFTAAFTPPRAGTFIYHSHGNEVTQINSGLYGPLIVVEPGASLDTARELVLIVGGAGPEDTPEDPPAWVNGTSSPGPINLRVGETYRFRLINIHSDWRIVFSLLDANGMAVWRPVAKDGADLPPAQQAMRPSWFVTGPGETGDFEFTPSAPGELRLEVKTQVTGWIIPVPVHVTVPAGR